MSKVHGIVYAYHSSPRLGDLTRYRTNASLPFCGRYRLIDFALSSLSNAGVHSVGVIMQRDYQSAVPRTQRSDNASPPAANPKYSCLIRPLTE